MPPNKRQPDFSKSRSLVVFLKRVIIYRLRLGFLIYHHNVFYMKQLVRYRALSCRPADF